MLASANAHRFCAGKICGQCLVAERKLGEIVDDSMEDGMVVLSMARV